jgi:hypothetical protein
MKRNGGFRTLSTPVEVPPPTLSTPLHRFDVQQQIISVGFPGFGDLHPFVSPIDEHTELGAAPRAITPPVVVF